MGRREGFGKRAANYSELNSGAAATLSISQPRRNSVGAALRQHSKESMDQAILEWASKEQARHPDDLPLCWNLPWCQKELSEHAMDGMEIWEEILRDFKEDDGTFFLGWMTMWMWLRAEKATTITCTLRALQEDGKRLRYFETRSLIAKMISRGFKSGILKKGRMIRVAWLQDGYKECGLAILLDIMVLHGTLTREWDEIENDGVYATP